MSGFDVNRLNGELNKTLITEKNKSSFKNIDPAIVDTSKKGDQTIILGTDDNIYVINSNLLKESTVKDAILFVEEGGILKGTDNALKTSLVDINKDGKKSIEDSFDSLFKALEFINSQKDNILRSIAIGNDGKFYVFNTSSPKVLSTLGLKDYTIVSQTGKFDKTNLISNDDLLIEQIKKDGITSHELAGVAKLITDEGNLTPDGKKFLSNLIDKAQVEFLQSFINIFNDKNNFSGQLLKSPYDILLNSITGIALTEGKDGKCSQFLESLLKNNEKSRFNFDFLTKNFISSDFKETSIDIFLTNLLATGSGARFLAKTILEPSSSEKDFYPKVVDSLKRLACEGNRGNQIIFNIFSDPNLGFLDTKKGKLTEKGRSFLDIIKKDNPNLASIFKDESNFFIKIRLKTATGRNQLLESIFKGNEGLIDLFFDNEKHLTDMGKELFGNLVKYKATSKIDNPDKAGAILLFNMLNQKGGTFRDVNGNLTPKGELILNGLNELGNTEYVNTLNTLNQKDMPDYLDPKLEDQFVKENKDKMIKIIEKMGYNGQSKHKGSIAEWVLRAGYRYHIDPRLLAAQLNRESIGFQLTITSPVGAMGIAQFMPTTARAYGVKFLNQGPSDLQTNDPVVHIRTSILGQAKFLRNHIDKIINIGFNETDATLLALNAYNGGPGAFNAAGNGLEEFAKLVHKAQQEGKKPIFPNKPKSGLLAPLVKSYETKGELPHSFYEVNKYTKILETRWYVGFITQALLNALKDNELVLKYPNS